MTSNIKPKPKSKAAELEALELARKQAIRDKVSKVRQIYKDLGLSPLQLYLPLESFQRFKELAVHERVTCNCPLPTDLADLARFQPDLFGVIKSPELIKLERLEQIIEEFKVKAHPSSPRWAEARKLLSVLEGVL